MHLRDNGHPRRQLFKMCFVVRSRHTSEAYIFPLTYLPIEPQAFNAAPKVEVPNPPGVAAFHYIARFGDFTCTINRDTLAEYAAASPPAGSCR